jgi:hypothetical protein
MQDRSDANSHFTIYTNPPQKGYTNIVLSLQAYVSYIQSETEVTKYIQIKKFALPRLRFNYPPT